MTSPQFFTEANVTENYTSHRWRDVLGELEVKHKIHRKKLPGKVKDFNIRYILGGEYSGVYLTERQRLVLIEFLKDKSAKAIALKLNISERTVEDYSKILRAKFNCATKRVLIEKLIGLNYCNILAHLKSTHKECVVSL
ncbi:MAG: LuxR C-terminal-related transcriptional regulator [Coxiellaceae bacterium]|nr:LuxR C-terminal-related transcriptional regulator [Coxiellaceae bacterium]